MENVAAAPAVPLATLAARLPGARGADLPRVAVTGVVCDSRQVQPGAVFVAVRGTAANGEEYVHDAIRRGALAVVAERPLDLPEGVPLFVVRDARRALAALACAFYRRPSEEVAVVGITGTNGKTTTTFIVRSIIQAAGGRCGLIGTVQCDLGARAFPSAMTTPDAADLQRMLREMADAGLTHAAMEVSSHALDQRRADFIRFRAAVFTNLTGDHLDYHGTMEAYREAKGRLFRSLRPNACAVLNADDPASETFATPAMRLWYGTVEESVRARAVGEGAPWLTAREVCGTLDGTEFILHFEEEGTPREVAVAMPLIGRYNLANALGAAGAALALGCGLEDVRKGLAALQQVPGRLERVPAPAHGGPAPCVLVDYAHTHDALESVLGTLRPLVRGRLIVVFGAGGDRDRTKRPKMGRAVERWADEAWITSDNPRSEDPAAIIAEIRAGMQPTARCHTEVDRRRAIEEAVASARPDDVVLIAGKGHETTQKIGDRVLEFDDRVVAGEVLDFIGRRARRSA